MAAAEIKARDQAPDFNAPDDAGHPFSLRSSTAEGPVVLLFFPSVWGMMCNVELGTFRDMASDFDKAGGRLVALCTNSVMSISAYKEQLRIPFPILSDFSGEISNRFGILFGDEGYLKGRCNRAIFIVDRSMTVRFVWIAEDPSYEADYDAVLMAVTEVAQEDKC